MQGSITPSRWTRLILFFGRCLYSAVFLVGLVSLSTLAMIALTLLLHTLTPLGGLK